jgi:tRNA (cmo5U34)-methyltransferase
MFKLHREEFDDMTDASIDDFDDGRASEYDERIQTVSPGYDALHRCVASLCRAHLDDQADILVAGAGTGRELVALAEARPGWHLTAVDPSEEMLQRCRDRVREREIADRVDLVCRDVESLDVDATYEAATSILVAHFIDDFEDRVRYFQSLADVLEPGGLLVFADLFEPERGDTATSLRDAWAASLRLTGMSEDDVADAFERIDDDISFETPSRLRTCLESAGFQAPDRFFQTLCWGGWWTRRTDDA